MDKLTFNEIVNMITFCKSNLVANLPEVSGAMKRSVKSEITFNPSINNVLLGRLSINVPYANYVNYGYPEHPKSYKLKRDYHIVERTMRNSLRAILQNKGVKVR